MAAVAVANGWTVNPLDAVGAADAAAGNAASAAAAAIDVMVWSLCMPTNNPAAAPAV
jgi:hypothetical protein